MQSELHPLVCITCYSESQFSFMISFAIILRQLLEGGLL